MDDCRPVWFYQHPSYGNTWQEFPGTLLHEVEMAYQDYTQCAGAARMQIYIGQDIHQTTATISFSSMRQISSGKIVRKIWRLLQPTNLEECRPVWFYQHPSYGCTWQEFPPRILYEVEMAYQNYTKHAGAPRIQIHIGRGVHQTTATINFISMQQISSRNIVRDIWRLLQPRRPPPVTSLVPPDARRSPAPIGGPETCRATG